MPAWLLSLLMLVNYIIGFLMGRWVTLQKLKEAIDKVKKEMRDEFQESHMQ